MDLQPARDGFFRSLQNPVLTLQVAMEIGDTQVKKEVGRCSCSSSDESKLIWVISHKTASRESIYFIILFQPDMTTSFQHVGAQIWETVSEGRSTSAHVLTSVVLLKRPFGK